MGCHGKNRNAGRFGLRAFCVLSIITLCGSAIATEYERTVIAECFTSPTCGYCPYAGRALNRMMTELPETFVSVQYHTSGSGYFAWVNERWSYYYVSGDGTPLTWFDGWIKRLGAYTNDQQMYEWYMDAYNTRIAVETDIGIEMTALETATNTYEVGITISEDPDHGARDQILHVLQVLDYYPSSTDNRYRNCARQHQEITIHTEPGSVDTYNMTFTLGTLDASNIEDVKFVAFSQRIGTSPKAIINAGVMSYPFPPPQTEIIGDVDGDGDVDLSDLAALLGVYGTCAGDANYNDAADFVDDDCIGLSDLAALLSNYGYGG